MANVDVNVPLPDVDGWLGTLNSYAQDASQNAQSLAQALSTFRGANYEPETSFDKYTPNIVLTKPTDIDAPILEIIERTPPSALQIDIPIVDIGLGDFPILEAIAPNIILPAVPDALTEAVPEKNFTLDLDKPFPLAPDSTLPSLPTLVDLNLPDDISIITPLFDGVIPDSASIGVPGNTFFFSEDPYSSSLLTDIQSELLSRLQGGTGIPVNVEQAIWDRGRDREQVAALQAERSITVDRVSQGFTRPSGAAMAALERVVQETQGKIIDLSREVMIKQAELEQENFKFSMQQAISLESTLISQYNNVQQRAFEVAKFLQEVSFEVYKLLVNKFNVELEAYKTSAQVFQIKVQAELSKVEVFKAQIDAEKTKNEINDQNIRIYQGQISAINTSVEIYKATVQAVAEELRAEALKVEVYKSEIDAYSALVGAKSEEFRAYSDQVKAEVSRVDIYDSQVKAFTSRIQGYSIGKDVEIKQADLEMKVQELKITKYLADIEGFIKQVQSDQSVTQSNVDNYRAQLQAYLADVGFNTAAANIGLKEADVIIQQNEFDVTTAIERIKVRAQLISDENKNRVAGLQAAGATYAQLAGSSLNAIKVSTSASGSAGANVSETYNHALST